MNTSRLDAGTPRSGFRGLKVVAKVRESAIITSFHLEPLEAQDWRPFEPGQFLVFRLHAQGDQGSLLRNYSVSSAPQQGSYRITVKREAAPSADVPDGASSCYLHDHVEVGDILMADGPRGSFVLDCNSTRPVVLLSGGVGLTPLVAMLYALVATQRNVVFLHACENGAVHALRDEVEMAVSVRPGMTAHFCYRVPTGEDRAAGRHHSEGVVTRELMQRLLPLDDYDFYLCGPSPFMRAMYELLRGLGVQRQRIAYEFFGPATLLETPAEPARAEAPAPAQSRGAAVTVEFRKSGQMAVWNPAAESLLAFAEDEGLSPDFSCRAGVCGTCQTHLVSGEVAYFEEPLDQPPAGAILLCCSKPRGPVVLDL